MNPEIIATVMGTRPEIIKMAPIITDFEKMDYSTSGQEKRNIAGLSPLSFV